ncbi:MAG: carboxypeptidase regulatory-like domain-containing protein [Candidatus Acidiferrales bacterium]
MELTASNETGGVTMKIWKIAFLVVVLAGSLFAISSASAQNLQRGEIRGFVFDSSHSIVPGAHVTVSNSSTGYKREQTTDQAGSYDFAQLLPGVYEIKAEASGFASITLTDITVEIGASLNLDVTLPVKGQTQSVTVTAAEAGAVDTTTAGINQIINQKNIEDLPLSGRDYRDLANLSSSAQVVPGLRGGIRLGGQQSDYAGLVIDGQDSFNNFFGEFFGSLETKNFTVPLESVQEFQVVTNGFAPEFGRATGGLINVITKSGTNELHGEAHEYYRGSGLTANDAVGNPPNIDNQNQIGGSVGFPISKDRQFLFLSADVQRENGPLVTNFCGVGSAADCATSLSEATGPVFANCTAPVPDVVAAIRPQGGLGPGTCLPGQIPAPGTAGTAGFALPPSCGTPAAGDSFLNACFGVNSLGDFNLANNQFQNLFTILGHYDFQITPANHFSTRAYFTRNHTSGFTGGLGQNETPIAFGGTENFVNQGASAVFALNTVLGRKVNEVRFSYQRETRDRNPNGPGQPTILVGPALFGQRYYLPITGTNAKFQIGDNFAYSFGKHDIKFGGDVDTFRDSNDAFIGWSTGQYDFGTVDDFNNASPFGFIQNLGLNNIPLLQAGLLKPAYQTGVGLYVQDKWQITPRFTLTYGLRWDGTRNPAFQTPFPGQETWVGTGANSHTIPIPQHMPNDWTQWGPRVGFAWNIGSTDAPTVIRGAWGFYYAQLPTIFLPTGGGGKTVGLFCFSGPTCQPTPQFPYLFPNTTSLGINQLCDTPDPQNGVVYGCPGPNIVDPNFKNPRISNLTGSIEHTFARSWTATLTFAWANSQHLRTGGYGSEEAWYRNFTSDGTDQFGRAILTGVLDDTLASSTNITASYAHGNYVSGVFNLTKRFTNHFQIFTNYIWSQNKDNGASERDTDTYFGQQDPFNINLDYGRNGLDIKHQFKAGGVYELPMGFTVSGTLIAHSGVPFPLYLVGDPGAPFGSFAGDINGDGVANSGFSHNNDRPSFTSAGGKTFLLGRYVADQPGFAELDARLQKDFKLSDRYHIQLSGDFFNLTNRGNVYSNPDTNANVDYAPNCTARGGGELGWDCSPFTASTLAAAKAAAGFRVVNQIAPGSTPFAFQAGAKFIF